MGLLNTLRFVVDHPLNRGSRFTSLVRVAAWQAKSRLTSEPILVDFVGGSKLVVSRGQTGATGNIYTGLHELPEMALVLHTLRPEDLFVDVGANVGSYTIIAACAVGARCIAFEPDSKTVEALRANVTANSAEGRVDIRQSVVGDQVGEATFTIGRDTHNHVVDPGTDHSVTIPATTLDAALEGESPTIIKVDVEGYEQAVLRGASNVMSNPRLLAAILETNGSGNRYSASDDDLHEAMLGFGFKPCAYDPFNRNVALTAGRSLDGNTIYVRDIESVSARVKSAPLFDVAGRRFI
jgi:FkbM family methyltransferase